MLSLMVIQIAWSGSLLGYLIYPPPWIKVDSLKDLSHRPDLTPVGFKYEHAWEYVRSRFDPVAAALDDRMVDFVYGDENVDEALENMFRDCDEGRSALINGQLVIEHIIYTHLDQFPDLYVTRDFSVLQPLPYFMLLSPKVPSSIARLLNATQVLFYLYR